MGNLSRTLQGHPGLQTYLTFVNSGSTPRAVALECCIQFAFFPSEFRILDEWRRVLQNLINTRKRGKSMRRKHGAKLIFEDALVLLPIGRRVPCHYLREGETTGHSSSLELELKLLRKKIMV